MLNTPSPPSDEQTYCSTPAGSLQTAMNAEGILLAIEDDSDHRRAEAAM